MSLALRSSHWQSGIHGLVPRLPVLPWPSPEGAASRHAKVVPLQETQPTARSCHLTPGKKDALSGRPGALVMGRGQGEPKKRLDLWGLWGPSSSVPHLSRVRLFSAGLPQTPCREPKAAAMCSLIHDPPATLVAFLSGDSGLSNGHWPQADPDITRIMSRPGSARAPGRGLLAARSHPSSQAKAQPGELQPSSGRQRRPRVPATMWAENREAASNLETLLGPF